MIGLTLPVLIGMAALGTEVGLLEYKHRQLQTVADAAALSAATAIQIGYPNFAAEARAVTAALGLQDGLNGVTITPNSPPTSGPNLGNNAAVEVLVSQPQTMTLGALFRSGPFNVAARAVAIAGAGSGCVLQLDSTTKLAMSNGATANLVSCGVAVDSSATAALSMTGGSVLNAQLVSVVGTASITGGATINPSSALHTKQARVADPYAGVTMPSLPGGCSNGTNKQYTHSNLGVQTVYPGVWCSGVAFTNDANMLLKPGVYYVDRGNFSVGGSVIMNGTGVTIVLTSSTGSSYATATINNGANVTLTAPTTGATAGIVFFGDRRTPKTTVIDFSGGAAINITGALYFPSESIIFQNGANNPSGCTQLIAGTIQLTGGSKFQNNCPASVAHIGGAKLTLAE